MKKPYVLNRLKRRFCGFSISHEDQILIKSDLFYVFLQENFANSEKRTIFALESIKSPSGNMNNNCKKNDSNCFEETKNWLRDHLCTNKIWNYQDSFYILKDAHLPRTEQLDYIAQNYVTLLCMDGEGTGTLDGIPIRMKHGSMVTIIPGQRMILKEENERFLFDMYVLSPSFAEKVTLENTYSILRTIQNLPIIQLNKEEENIVEEFLHMCSRTIREEGNPFREKILQLYIELYYLEVGYLFTNRREKTTDVAGPKPRSAEIMIAFDNLIQRYYRAHRDVAWYAEQLRITPKHLSAVCKQEGGHSASWWIDRLVIRDAEHMLQYSNDDIQQIAYALGFEDMSAFGKYFKRQRGVSPSRFRKNH